jgi:hypothetical protein
MRNFLVLRACSSLSRFTPRLMTLLRYLSIGTALSELRMLFERRQRWLSLIFVQLGPTMREFPGAGPLAQPPVVVRWLRNGKALRSRLAGLLLRSTEQKNPVGVSSGARCAAGCKTPPCRPTLARAAHAAPRACKVPGSR